MKDVQIMDRNETGDIVLKGEIPTEAEFARLLCDKTFVDYFNTFLSLPVFAQRLLYRFKEQTFELDPPLKRTKYRLDRVKLMRWVRTQRAPLFFRTDLYLEYLLCKALQRTQLQIHAAISTNDPNSAKDRILDHRLMSRWLGRVSGMNRFRRFLAQTTGERSLAFWLDAERFRKSAKDGVDEHLKIFRLMEAKYFKYGASMELPEHAKWPAFSTRESKPETPSPKPALTPTCPRQRRHSYFVGGGVEVETRLPCGSLFGDDPVSRDAFVVIQGFILKTLQNYWVPRFIIHCKTRWSRDQITYQAIGPQWYATKVRSLSELAADGNSEEVEPGKSSHLLLGGGIKKLQKQSMTNLMAMFSSRGMRNSDLNAMLKMEDTGGKVGSASGETYDDGWLVEEFPLATISEESHISSRSRSTSHSAVSSRAATPVSPEPSADERRTPTPEPKKKPGSSHALKTHSGKRTNRVRRSGTRAASPLAREPHEQSQSQVPDIPLIAAPAQEQPEPEASGLFGEEPKEEVKEQPVQADQEAPATNKQEEPVDESQTAPTATEPEQPEVVPAESSSDAPAPTEEAETDHKDDTRRHSISSETDDVPEDEKGRHTPSFMQHNRRRRNSITPVPVRTSSNTSVSHGSNTSIASLAGSKRRVSITAGHKPRPPPPRRQRSQSVEFRLADFSMLFNATGDDPTEKAEEMTPQLEADLQALKAHQENEEKKKEEGKTKKKGKRYKSKAGAWGQKSSKKEKGKPQQRLKGAKFAKLTQLNLARFDAIQSGRHVFRSPISPMHTTVFQDIIQPEGTGSSMDASLKKKQKEFEKKDYAKLSFEQKLEHDDFKLLTLPRISSPLPPLKSQSMSSSGASTKSSTRYTSSFSQSIKLPKLLIKPETLAPPSGMNISKLSYCGYNLGEPNYRYRHQLLVGAIAADRLAGGPFEKYLNRQIRVTDINYLQFWQISQEYLTTGANNSDLDGISVRQRQAQNITATFLTQSGAKFITLGDGLTEELKKQLPSNTGDELLTHSQDLACEAVRDSWEAYRKHDQDEFLTRTTSRKPFADVLPRTKRSSYSFPSGLPSKVGLEDLPSATDTGKQLIQRAMENARKLGTGGDKKTKKKETDDEDEFAAASHRMWKSLHLAQWTSRLNPESADLSDPSDPESDSEDEGSLRRKPILVVRKRKVKRQVDIIRSWTPSLEMKRIKFEREVIIPAKEKETPTVEVVAKAVCKAIRKDGKTIHRPPRPRSFQGVLHDTSHLEFFKRFMIREKAETPLQFWQTVENMRKTCRDAKSRQSKTIMIIRKFFNKGTDFGAALQCDAEIIMDIPNMEKVTPQMLLSAQACVARSMEEKWFASYQDTFPDESPPPEISVNESSSQPKLVPKEKNKALWGMFIHNVTSFRRGLMNPISLNLFKSYLGLEVSREIEKQKQTGTQSRRLICNKVIIVDRLGNDLGFWAEVERFKDLADSAAAAAAAGTYTLEDEEYVQQKAKAIIDCYIDSQIPPKLQINIPQELADEMMDTAQNGLIERGLFHEAAVSTFTVLLYCWKKFCRERFAPLPVTKVKTPTKPKRRRKKRRAPSTPLVCGVKIKTIIGQNVEEPPKMQFTLQHGIQLILPPKPPKVEEEKQNEHIQRVMRQLYPNVGDVFRNGEERLAQLYHQLIQQHGPQGIQTLLQKRRFSHFKTLGNTPLPFARYFNPQAQIP